MRGSGHPSHHFILTWPDGSRNVIHCNNTDIKFKNGDWKVNRWFSIDGVRQESSHFVIKR